LRFKHYNHGRYSIYRDIGCGLVSLNTLRQKYEGIPSKLNGIVSTILLNTANDDNKPLITGDINDNMILKYEGTCYRVIISRSGIMKINEIPAKLIIIDRVRETYKTYGNPYYDKYYIVFDDGFDFRKLLIKLSKNKKLLLSNVPSDLIKIILNYVASIVSVNDAIKKITGK